MDTLSNDKLAIFVISPQFLTEILSKGLCAKPTHGLKDPQVVSLGLDRKNGSLILCVSSESVPDYVAFMRVMEQSIPVLNDTTIFNGIEMTGIPVIPATFENVSVHERNDGKGNQ